MAEAGKLQPQILHIGFPQGQQASAAQKSFSFQQLMQKFPACGIQARRFPFLVTLLLTVAAFFQFFVCEFYFGSKIEEIQLPSFHFRGYAAQHT